MMMRAHLTLAVSVLALLACTPPNPGPVTPAPDADAMPGPPNTALCGPACAHLADLGCPEGQFDAGDGCAGACMHTGASGAFRVDPACWLDAGTVDAARGCGLKCRKP